MRTVWQIPIWFTVTALCALLIWNEPTPRFSGNWNAAPGFQLHQTPKFTTFPVQVSAGPLLFHEQRVSKDRMRYFFVDPERSKEPVPFLEASSEILILERVDSEVLLMEGPDGLFLLQMRDGLVRELGPGAPCGTEKNTLNFYRYEGKGRPFGPRHLYELKPSWRHARRVSGLDLVDVTQNQGRYLVQAASGEYWLIGGSGESRTHTLLKNRPNRSKICRPKWSPDATLLAFGEEVEGQMDLVVLDSSNGSEVARTENVPIGVEGGTLCFDWVGARTIRLSKTVGTFRLDSRFHSCVWYSFGNNPTMTSSPWADFDLETGELDKAGPDSPAHQVSAPKFSLRGAKTSPDLRWELKPGATVRHARLVDNQTEETWILPNRGLRWGGIASASMISC